MLTTYAGSVVKLGRDCRQLNEGGALLSRMLLMEKENYFSPRQPANAEIRWVFEQLAF